VLAVRLTPRGGRDAIDGIEQLSDGRRVLKVRVRAAASEGEANAALTKLVARTLGVPSRKSAASGNPVHPLPPRGTAAMRVRRMGAPHHPGG
jgi:Uncharacterised ACR, YggU family COG1872